VCADVASGRPAACTNRDCRDPGDPISAGVSPKRARITASLYSPRSGSLLRENAMLPKAVPRRRLLAPRKAAPWALLGRLARPAPVTAPAAGTSGDHADSPWQSKQCCRNAQACLRCRTLKPSSRTCSVTDIVTDTVTDIVTELVERARESDPSSSNGRAALAGGLYIEAIPSSK
jgi:hypothetical protein